MDSKDTFCAFGDSITAGGLWVAEVFENLAPRGIKVYNCGVAGDTAYDSLRRIEQDCLCHLPSVVTVMFGINDMEHWIKPDELKPDYTDFLYQRYDENLEKVITVFQEHQVRVIVMSPPPYVEGDCFATLDFKCNQRVKHCAEFAKIAAQKHGCEFIDINGIFRQIPNMIDYFSEDRVHPNEKGQRIIAKTVMRQLGFDYKSDCEEPFDFSPLNRERMKADALYKDIMYAKHDLLGKHCDRMGVSMTEDEAFAFVKQIADRSGSFAASCSKAYCGNIDRLDEIKEEIEKLTEKMVTR